MPRRRWRPWLCRPRYPRPVQTAQRPERRTIREFFSWVSFVEIGTIHVVLVHYYDRPGLGDLAPTREVEVGETYAVAPDRARRHFSPGSIPSAIVASRSLQSSFSRAVSRYVSSQVRRCSFPFSYFVISLLGGM